MIRVRYHPELIEQSVWLAVRREASLEHELHRDVDPIYKSFTGDAREQRFQHTFAGWFARLRLDAFVDEALSHFSRIVHELRECIVRPAVRRKSEGAELFVPAESAPQQGTLAIQLCPESLINTEGARDGMLRELQHVEDMLDPAFGYEREVIDGLPSHRQVTLERYRLLWDIRVERILTKQGLIARSHPTKLRERFAQAFMVAQISPPDGLFDRLWEQDVGAHSDLFTWSNDPRAWFESLTGQVRARNTRALGDPCPICTFPTFDWFPLTEPVQQELVARLRRARAGWDVSDGMCRQCAETYLSGVLV